MFVTIITDCQDPNTFGRQLTRASSLFGFSSIPVAINNDVEAAGNLIDILDASEGREGVVLVNIAPRHGRAKKWPNGTPFGFFNYHKTLVVSSIDGYALSLVKKLGIISEINVMDIPTVLDFMEEEKIYEEQPDYIKNTQFRSFEFVPRAAKWIFNGIDLPVEKMRIEQVPDIPKCVWWVDSFGQNIYGGNCKTTILPEEVEFESGKEIKLKKVGQIKCYERLKDVPNNEQGLIIGSSGILNKRFLEVVIQGNNASEKFHLNTGDVLL